MNGGNLSVGVGSVISMDELLRNMYSDDGEDAPGAPESSGEGEMTLEDFLEKEGAVIEEDVTATFASARDPLRQTQHLGLPVGDRHLEVGNGAEKGVGRERKGRKRTALDPVDQVVLKRQSRMIKNRESAARSRERKQAYTVELETLVTQLEEENAKLRVVQEQQRIKRLEQLMQTLIPVTDEKKPRRTLGRTHSMQW